jgi:hypothetical protein
VLGQLSATPRSRRLEQGLVALTLTTIAAVETETPPPRPGDQCRSDDRFSSSPRRCRSDATYPLIVGSDDDLRRPLILARSATRTTIGLPPMSDSGLPGRRVDA